MLWRCCWLLSRSQAHMHSQIRTHAHTYTRKNVYECVCMQVISGNAHERKLKTVGNNICVVVSFLNGSIQDLSIRHATFCLAILTYDM